jgi:hypothetical protein
MKLRHLAVLTAGLICASSQALDGFTPAPGYTAFDLGLTGSAIAISPDGKLAVGNDSVEGSAWIDIYDGVLAGRSQLGTIWAPEGHTWRYLSDLEWLDADTLLIAENGEMDTAYSANLADGPTPLAPIGSVPNITGLAVAFGGGILASASNDPGSGCLYVLAGGSASIFAPDLGAGYLAGLAFRDELLFVADTNDPDFLGNPGQVLALNADGEVVDVISLAGGGGSGVFDIAFDSEGDLIATTGATLTGAGQPFGTFSGGWPFPTYLAYHGSRFEPYDGDGLLLVNGTFTDVAGIFAVTPVAEPSMLLGGFAALLLLRRRK